MNNTVIVVVVVLAALGVAGVLLLSVLAKRAGGKTVAVRARVFMTPNEAQFLQRLEAAVPEFRFHAQVSMAALLDPAVTKRANSRAWWRARTMFSQKIIDYVAQRRDNGQIVAVIELDDRTHNAGRDARRDAMLQQAGYRTVRWQSKDKPSRAEIFAALVGPPPAPPATKPAVPVITTSVRGELWGRTAPAKENVSI